MSFEGDFLKQPWRFDFYTLMRRAERHHKGKPRIGDSATLAEEFVMLGQDPHLEFPASTFNRATKDQAGRLKAFVRFLGMLGPQGALPLATTEESWNWNRDGDESFARFLDLFEHRFLQLFFRAWADARPIAHHDRPGQDRFSDYVGSQIGLGSPPYRGLDSLPDLSKLTYAGLLAPQTKSADRLKALLAGLFGLKVEVDEFVGSRLVFEPEDRSKLGRALCSLNQDFILGASVFSVEDKIKIRLFAADLDQYRDFLPSGKLCPQLTDAVYFYLGDEMDWDVELALPANQTRPIILSKSKGLGAQLGWTSWLAPHPDSTDAVRADARFHPMSRRKAPTLPVTSKKRGKGH